MSIDEKTNKTIHQLVAVKRRANIILTLSLGRSAPDIIGVYKPLLLPDISAAEIKC